MPSARTAKSGARRRLSREARVAQERAAFAREQEKHAAGLTRARRKLGAALNFWRVCAHKACRRARGCAGDADACFVHFWPHVPEEIKIRIQAGIVARRAGGSEADMVRAGEEALARQRACAAPATGHAAASGKMGTHTPCAFDGVVAMGPGSRSRPLAWPG